jgi:hypothetical protein
MPAASGSQDCGDLPWAGSCDAEGTLASQPSREPTNIAFINRGDKPVKIYWLNFQGQRILYNPNLAPGGQHTQQTFVGHNWVVTTLTEQCLGVFTTDMRSSNEGASSSYEGVSASDEGASASYEGASVAMAPPPLPDYEQPPPPQENLVWTPGYWAWSEDLGDYYWVSGDWVDAPIVGYLWTPGYWVVHGPAYFWRAGYWGPHVGFYGGINYGHGYFGRGFVGGSWRDGRMTYNSAVTNVGNLKPSDVYHQPVADNASAPRVSFNGARGGTRAQPNAAETAAAAEYHIAPTAAQNRQLQSAHDNPAMSLRSNEGHPPTRVSSRPEHAGTLSVMHAAAPTPAAPTRATPTRAEPAKAAYAPKSAASAAWKSPAEADPARVRQSTAHIVEASAEPSSTPKEGQPARPNAPTARPRTVTPHPEGH